MSGLNYTRIAIGKSPNRSIKMNYQIYKDTPVTRAILRSQGTQNPLEFLANIVNEILSSPGTTTRKQKVLLETLIVAILNNGFNKTEKRLVKGQKFRSSDLSLDPPSKDVAIDVVYCFIVVLKSLPFDTERQINTICDITGQYLNSF